MTSMFNPDLFLQQATQGKMETRRTAIPASTEYVASVKDIKLRAVKEFVMCDIFWEIQEVGAGIGLKDKLGLRELISRQSIFLDIREDGQGLATGPNKNVQLGRVREALGLNNDGPFMLLQLKGQGPAKVQINNRPDDKDPTIVYDEVAAVTRYAA